MDGRRFDQLVKALAHGASRRRVLKGFVAGAAGAALAQARTPRVRAQCTWSGTFETAFGGIAMTLNEADGQVSGSYTFLENNAVTTGTITGVVRTDSPGYTVLDGYWRESNEGGRIWFTMPLDTCAQFAGSYTGADTAQEWIAGWDGVRTDAGLAGDGEAEATLFSNPGDTRAAAFTLDGRSGTLFGPKDAEGGVVYIDHAQIGSPDGDPRSEVFLDFDAAGSATRARLGSGETMLFTWLSPTSLSITYQSADGSQEVQFPYEASQVTTREPSAAHPIGYLTQAQGAEEVRQLAFAGLPAAVLMTSTGAAHHAAQSPTGNPGVIEVRCGNGALVAGAEVTGTVAPANAPGTPLLVSFTETTPGVFAYSLPIAPAPQPGEQFHRTRVERALMLICFGNTALLLTQASKEYICATLLGIPAVGTVGFAACEVVLTSYVWMCRLNFARTVGGAAVDFFANAYEVTALAQHKKLGTKQIKVNASAGAAIPNAVAELTGGAAISDVAISPPDPQPSEGYEVRVSTACAPIGATLTVSVVGTDEFVTSTEVTLSETVTEATLFVPGGAQGIQDTITIQMSGANTDTTTRTIVF
jgi:hypothetical protein